MLFTQLRALRDLRDLRDLRGKSFQENQILGDINEERKEVESTPSPRFAFFAPSRLTLGCGRRTR
jgi:hypothetical protein